jgi:hypothetical protein
VKAASVTAAYAVFYPCLCDVAREHGYPLAIHGTMQRDCDLVAIPWTDKAVAALTLVAALKEACGGCYWHPERDKLYYNNGTPTVKPHGRVAYSLHLTDRGGEGPYFDVSIMPRRPADCSTGEGDGI